MPKYGGYLSDGIQFLRSSFELPFYVDQMRVQVTNRQTHMTYRIPLKRSWLNKGLSPEEVTTDLSSIHKALSDALLWTNLGQVTFTSETGEKGDFYTNRHPGYQANWVLTGAVNGEESTLDTFKAAMVLALTMQLGLAGLLEIKYVRHGQVPLPLTTDIAEAIASILQTSADPTLNTLDRIAEHYVNSWCLECTHFRASSSLPNTGYCHWANASIPEFLGSSKNHDPLWRVFVTHPRLQTGLYDADEREEATNEYRDRVAQWFDSQDQVTIDPVTLHLVEDVLHAAKSEEELQDTDTVLPRALRLMDFWHSGYLPPSNESHPENPTLLHAIDRIPDAILPLVLSSLTVIPPLNLCIGYLPNDNSEIEVAGLQLGTKPLRDVLLQSIPRRVLELLASAYMSQGENVHIRLMEFLYEQASTSFERIMMDYEEAPPSWLFDPVPFHLTDVLYIHTRLSAFVRDVTLEAIRRIRTEDRKA